MKNKLGFSVSDSSGFNFTETDFSLGSYALIIDNQNPPLLIDEATVLEVPKNNLEVKYKLAELFT